MIIFTVIGIIIVIVLALLGLTCIVFWINYADKATSPLLQAEQSKSKIILPGEEKE